MAEALQVHSISGVEQSVTVAAEVEHQELMVGMVVMVGVLTRAITTVETQTVAVAETLDKQAVAVAAVLVAVVAEYSQAAAVEL